MTLDCGNFLGVGLSVLKPGKSQVKEEELILSNACQRLSCCVFKIQQLLCDHFYQELLKDSGLIPMHEIKTFAGGRKAYRMTMLYFLENVVLKTFLVNFPHPKDNWFDFLIKSFLEILTHGLEW